MRIGLLLVLALCVTLIAGAAVDVTKKKGKKNKKPDHSKVKTFFRKKFQLISEAIKNVAFDQEQFSLDLDEFAEHLNKVVEQINCKII